SKRSPGVVHAQKGPVRLQLRTSGMHILAQDRVSTAVSERPQLLFDDGGGDAGIFFQPFSDGGFEGIEFAFTLPLGRGLRWRIEILLDGPPAHAQVAFDLANRPALAPVEAMQVVDLIGGEHWCDFRYPAETVCVPGRCCLQDSDCGGLRGGSASSIQTW